MQATITGLRPNRSATGPKTNAPSIKPTRPQAKIRVSAAGPRCMSRASEGAK